MGKRCNRGLEEIYNEPNIFDLLKPTVHVIHQQFNLFKAYWLRDAPTV
jgi:hypothetical protein